MEDDEETINVDESSTHDVEDSITENNRSETEKLSNTEQCDPVTELRDSQLVGVESFLVDKDAEAVAEIPSAVTEPEAAEGSGQKSDSMVEVAQVIGAESPIVAIDEKGEEEAAEEENPIAGTEMEMVVADDSGGKAFEELYDAESVRGGGDSVIVAKLNSDEAVAEEENAIADVEMETGTGMVVVNGSGGQSVDAQPVGSESFVLAKVEFDDCAMAEEENKTEMVQGESDGGKSVPELDNAQPVGDESPIAAEVEFEDDGMEEEENTMADAEMEREVVEGESGGGKFGDELDNATLLGAESPVVAKDDDDEEVVGEGGNETPMADNEMDVEMDTAEMVETDLAETPEGEKGTGSGGGGKRKRGRNSKVSVKAPSRKTIGDDVCFICFDGGDLVLCDRRACPKAYHPSCVNRDEAFFRAKGSWNCGWHICSNCEKNAYYMCYTCTFSLCKGCIKDAVILCIRGNKGFCETCMKTVMLIENNEQGNKEAQVDFDDKSSWEFLFKDYWIDLKAKLSVTSDELAQAKNPWKGSDVLASKQELPEELYDAVNDVGSGSDSSENLEASKKTKKRKGKKKLKSRNKEENVPYTAVTIDAEETALNTEWASKELLEFVMHMKDGDKSVLSQFDVQALLLEYIKRNKLRDPRRKSQIVCDSRLENLFGKPRVGHFEMLKLLESHFLIKEDSQIDDVQGTVVDTEVNQLEADGNADAAVKGIKDRRRRTRKKGTDRGPQSNLDDYAAIDIHNINFIYLRRKLMEDLIEDIENFHDKVVGTFVRIRISGSNQKQDLYRLVQVIGTTKAAEPYKIVKRTTDIMLEILNLDKTEVVSVDSISNQEFTEDECKRLRQSIKCGLINRMTVGDILEKATEIQAARVSDWLESEIVRLSHLRDRASEKGRKKELRECVEKLQLMKTPEERRRKLDEIPEIHADPKMDPSYESEEEDGETEDTKRDMYMRSRGSGFNRKGREPISPQGGSFSSKDSWSGTRSNSSKNLESNRNTSNENYLNKGEENTHIGEIVNENLEKSYSAVISGTVGLNSHSAVRSESLSVVASETSPVPHSTGLAETAETISETEKMWHYRDPSGKVQGPFSMVQLRKWSNTGFFPADLRIWRTTDKQDDSVLLTDALAGRFQKEVTQVENSYMKAQTVISPHRSSSNTEKPYGTSLQKMELSSSRGWATPSPEVSKLTTDTWGSDIANRSDSSNLPSPTPKQNAPGSAFGANSFTGGNGSVQSPTVATPDNGQSMRSSTPSYLNNPNGSKEQNALGFQVPTSVSGGQLIRGSEIDASSTHTGVNPAPNFEQGILAGSVNALPTFHSNVVGESHGVHPHAQHPPQVWASAPTQNVEQPNTSISAPGQPAFGQWGGVPSTVQNPAGNFSTPGFSAMPPPEPWRPPVQGNQPNTQSPAPPSVPWAMGVTENTNFAPVNPNTGWGSMPVNPNMGWGGPAPGSGNMNWGAVVQVPPPGNANPTWVAPGNPQPTIQMPVNPGWVPPSGNPGAPVQGLPPGNANAGWVMPAGNPGATVQGPPTGNGNPGWGPTTGNPGPTVQGPVSGNANQGWGPPGGNQGMWGSEQQRNGDQFSGGRQWNRQSSFGSGGRGRRGSSRPFPRGRNQPCPYNVNGRRCIKGASCDYLHT